MWDLALVVMGAMAFTMFAFELIIVEDIVMDIVNGWRSGE